MEDILYQETTIDKGLLKSKQVMITVYSDRLELAYSKAYSEKELNEALYQISYVEKKIIPYDKVQKYDRIAHTVLNITGYQLYFVGDFESEKAGKTGRKKITTAAIQTLDRKLWDALDTYTPLIPDDERRNIEEANIKQALQDGSALQGVLEIAVGKQMLKTMRLFINDIEWEQYTYPPVRVPLPLGTYRVKIARLAGYLETGTGFEKNYTYTNEVTITLSQETSTVRLAAKDGFLSPNLEMI